METTDENYYRHEIIALDKDPDGFSCMPGKKLYIEESLGDYYKVTGGYFIQRPLDTSKYKVVPLTGRYFKALIDKPQGVTPLKKGDVIKIESVRSNGTNCLSNGYVANVSEFTKDLWELLPLDYKEFYMTTAQDIFVVGKTLKDLPLVNKELICYYDSEGKVEYGVSYNLSYGEKQERKIVDVSKDFFKVARFNLAAWFSKKEALGISNTNLCQEVPVPEEKGIEFKEGDIVVSLTDAANKDVRKQGDILQIIKVDNDIIHYTSTSWCHNTNFRHATHEERDIYYKSISIKNIPLTPQKSFIVPVEDHSFEVKKESTNLIVTGKELLPLIEVKKRLIF